MFGQSRGRHDDNELSIRFDVFDGLFGEFNRIVVFVWRVDDALCGLLLFDETQQDIIMVVDNGLSAVMQQAAPVQKVGTPITMEEHVGACQSEQHRIYFKTDYLVRADVVDFRNIIAG